MPTDYQYKCPFPFSGPKVEEKGTNYTLVTKDDCFHFRQFVDDMEGYTLHHDEDGILVWDRKIKGESTNRVKVFGTFDCKPEVLYAVLQDPEYREAWDESRVEGVRLCRLDERQDIGYYAAKSPATGVSAREFLSQRAWHETSTGEFVIFNTGVNHADIPDKGKSGRVRALSKVTGYFIQPWGANGCTMTYITQLDPGGWIPHFVMNFMSTKFAPKVIQNMRKASKGYAEWVAKQTDHKRTWCIEPSEWPSAGPVEGKTQAAAKVRWESGDKTVVPCSVREGDAEEEAAATA